MFLQTILQIIPNYQLSFLIGNKDVDYLVVYVFGTRRSLKLRSGTKFESYFENCTTKRNILKY